MEENSIQSSIRQSIEADKKWREKENIKFFNGYIATKEELENGKFYGIQEEKDQIRNRAKELMYLKGNKQIPYERK